MTDYIVQDTGLDITGDMSLERCEIVLEALRQSKDSRTWALADMLVYANDKHGDDMYQILDQTNWAKSTISNYMTTARRIPRAVRRKTVSFTNHSELTADYLTDAQRNEALDKLEAKEWTRDDLRDWKRDLRGDDSEPLMTITLQAKAFTIKDGQLIVAFVEPLEAYDIIEYKAIVKTKVRAKDKVA